MKILKSYKKIAKSMLIESAWDRKFGEPLPTLEDTTKKHQTNEEPRQVDGEHKKEGSVTLSMLWLKRGLDFLDRFLKKFIDGTKTKAAARDAFETTLAPYQGWLLRTTCKAALKMVPTREKLGMILMLPTIDPMYWNEIVEEELRLLMSSYSIVILGMDEWFENEGLDDKAIA